MRRPRPSRLAQGALAVLLGACGARTELDLTAPVPCDSPFTQRRCDTICGGGVETCVDGFWKGCTAPVPLPPADRITLTGTVRDVHDTHPDFESTFAFGDDHAIVEPVLGADGAPVYSGNPDTTTTNGADAFFSWYHDVPGVNLSVPFAIELVREDADLAYVFHDSDFFPIDAQLFGNEGRDHNFHFTYALHAEFDYRGGEVFTFSGDDDVWLFLNGRLAIDLGGVHATEAATISLDALAEELGLVVGERHPFDLFFAERHTNGSTFHVETTLAGFEPCAPTP
jgi:fibro-slime domain-containing protein